MRSPSHGSNPDYDDTLIKNLIYYVKFYILEGLRSDTRTEMRDPYGLWINQASESEATEERYVKEIKWFETWVRENYGLEVREIPSRWREAKYESVVARERYLDQLKDLLKDYFGHLKAGYAPLCVNTLMATVASYMHAFDIPVKTLSLKHAYVKYHNRDITKEEIRRILKYSRVRDQAAYEMLYESGMRPITLSLVRWRHIKDEFLGHKLPMKIDLPSDILKCRVSERWTFIGEEGFEALKTYLVTRFPLKEDECLFVLDKPKGGELKPYAISQAFNRTVQKLGIAEPRGPHGRKPKEIRLYCLKKAFKDFHGAREDYKKFWMGRTETATHYLPRDIEKHRKEYSEGYENLRLYKPHVDAETIKRVIGENMDLRRRVERLEADREEIADLKEQIKRQHV